MMSSPGGCEWSWGGVSHLLRSLARLQLAGIGAQSVPQGWRGSTLSRDGVCWEQEVWDVEMLRHGRAQAASSAAAAA